MSCTKGGLTWTAGALQSGGAAIETTWAGATNAAKLVIAKALAAALITIREPFVVSTGMASYGALVTACQQARASDTTCLTNFNTWIVAKAFNYASGDDPCTRMPHAFVVVPSIAS